ncbi:LamG domain-containing protein [Kitasatospora sp. NPDC002227]|uniref:LamG domain-containing protein n=1 Tax=Kitasatospora sp. NPDC002227 TaxID=3154773 RepID=UPI0033192B6B
MPAASTYDTVVLADAPALYLPLGETGTNSETVGPGAVTYWNSPGTATLPNGDTASLFNGTSQYVEIPAQEQQSAATTGQLTVEAWIRPDSTTFPKVEGTGYVHWLGKLTYGPAGGCEWAARIYSQGNTEGRGNRISGYAFNPAGGLGAGSYFQDPVVPGQWIHYALVINSNYSSATYPAGYVRIYKDGALRDQDSLADYGIVPTRTPSPVRIGTASLRSYFLGAIGKVAIYPRELTASQIRAHHQAMTE